MLCMSGEVEDERHFVLDCSMYEDLRRKMFEVVKEVMRKNEEKEEEIEEVLKTEMGKQRVFRCLMGDGGEMVEGRADLRRAALVYCREAMKRRNRIVLRLFDQRT